jgi:hypothetical protein
MKKRLLSWDLMSMWLVVTFFGIVGPILCLTHSSPSRSQRELRELFVKYRLDFRLLQEMECERDRTGDVQEIAAVQQRLQQYENEAWHRFGCESVELYLKLDKEQRRIAHEQLELPKRVTK